MARKKHSKDAALAAAAKLLGRRGGWKGGPARARVLSAEERSKIAAKGGKATKGIPKSR